MSKTAFEALLIIKLQDFLSVIKEKNGDFDTSLKKLYLSNVYKLLKDEETKMWQLSSFYLYEILENEESDYAR